MAEEPVVEVEVAAAEVAEAVVVAEVVVAAEVAVVAEAEAVVEGRRWRRAAQLQLFHGGEGGRGAVAAADRVESVPDDSARPGTSDLRSTSAPATRCSSPGRSSRRR